jgi:hypothetical protein
MYVCGDTNFLLDVGKVETNNRDKNLHTLKVR